MEPFITHSGIAAPLLQDNIDTDQIIPSREMKTVSKTGLAAGLFAGQRYLNGRTPNPDFVLNQPNFEGATILLAGKNFGCGSSREHAAWALKDYGIRAVIAESFGEIFYNNCVRNGILCVVLSQGQIATLGKEITINLPAQTANGMSFDIPDGDKNMLVNGLDPIMLTLQDKHEIDDFFKTDKIARPWVYKKGD